MKNETIFFISLWLGALLATISNDWFFDKEMKLYEKVSFYIIGGIIVFVLTILL